MSSSTHINYSSVFDISPTTPLDTFLVESTNPGDAGVLEILNNIIDDLRQVKIEPAPTPLPHDETYQEEHVDDSAFLPTPEEFVHLTTNEHDWYHLKWKSALFFLQLDTLQILDSHMRIITMAIQSFNQMVTQLHGISVKTEISFLFEMRLDLWTQYRSIFQEMYRDGEFHKCNASTLNDLWNRNGRNLFVPRPKFRWVQYNPPYAGMPFVQHELTNCGRCCRDGHDQPECPFDWYNPEHFPIQNTLRPDQDLISAIDQIHASPSQPISNRKAKNRNFWKRHKMIKAQKQKEYVTRSRINRRNAGEVPVNDLWSNAWQGLADWN